VNERSFALHSSENTLKTLVPALPMTLQSRLTSPPSSEERSVEILERLRPVFVEKGFDGASMQDMARAAGMSVGNFYRYFPSKAAIVEAMIGIDLRELEAMFALIVQSQDPMQSLRQAIRLRVTQEECAGEGQLWAEISAAAMRKADIGLAARRMEEGVVENLCRVFAVATGLPQETTAQAWRTQAELILMLVKGCAMRHDAPLALSDDLTQMVLRMIDTLLDEIVADPAARNAKAIAHA
jgi:AcrR family transcriptional regulator